MKTAKRKPATAYIGFRTTHALKKQLTELARAARRPVSDVIEIVLEDLLVEDRNATAEANHHRALGRFHQAIDKYLPARD